MRGRKKDWSRRGRAPFGRGGRTRQAGIRGAAPRAVEAARGAVRFAARRAHVAIALRARRQRRRRVNCKPSLTLGKLPLDVWQRGAQRRPRQSGDRRRRLNQKRSAIMVLPCGAHLPISLSMQMARRACSSRSIRVRRRSPAQCRRAIFASSLQSHRRTILRCPTSPSHNNNNVAMHWWRPRRKARQGALGSRRAALKPRSRRRAFGLAPGYSAKLEARAKDAIDIFARALARLTQGYTFPALRKVTRPRPRPRAPRATLRDSVASGMPS